MGTGRLSRLALYAMAMLAVAFLNVASVQSALMQVAGVQADDAMAGMAMPGPPEICHTAADDLARATAAPGQAHKACPYCDAAANPPLCGVAVSAPTPASIAWTRYTVQTLLGARGPPAFAPNARGPPASTLTA